MQVGWGNQVALIMVSASTGGSVWSPAPVAETVIKSLIPLRALFGYSTAVRSATQDRTDFFMTFAKYDAWN